MAADLEPELCAPAIRRAQGNQAKDALWLGISRLRMREKLRRLGLHSTREPAADEVSGPLGPPSS